MAAGSEILSKLYKILKIVWNHLMHRISTEPVQTSLNQFKVQTSSNQFKPHCKCRRPKGLYYLNTCTSRVHKPCTCTQMYIHVHVHVHTPSSRHFKNQYNLQKLFLTSSGRGDGGLTGSTTPFDSLRSLAPPLLGVVLSSTN